MKKYTVRWELEEVETEINAESPQKAYKKFLQAEAKIKSCPVRVNWGIFGAMEFKDHIKTAIKQEAVSSKWTLKEQNPVSSKSPTKRYQSTTADPLENKSGELEEHKFFLRYKSAYSGLRGFLTFIAWLFGGSCVILGMMICADSSSKEVGVALLLFGPLVAALQYFITSVYFDMADAVLKSSMKTQNLEQVQSSK